MDIAWAVRSKSRPIALDAPTAVPTATCIECDHAEHCRLRAQSLEVGSDVARATESEAFTLGLEHQHRCLRRHAAGGTLDILIEDEVAHDEDTDIRQFPERARQRVQQSA